MPRARFHFPPNRNTQVPVFKEDSSRRAAEQEQPGLAVRPVPTGLPGAPSRSCPRPAQLPAAPSGGFRASFFIFTLSETSPFIFLTHRLPVHHRLSHPPPARFPKVMSKRPGPPQVYTLAHEGQLCPGPASLTASSKGPFRSSAFCLPFHPEKRRRNGRRVLPESGPCQAPARRRGCFGRLDGRVLSTIFGGSPEAVRQG